MTPPRQSGNDDRDPTPAVEHDRPAPAVEDDGPGTAVAIEDDEPPREASDRGDEHADADRTANGDADVDANRTASAGADADQDSDAEGDDAESDDESDDDEGARPPGRGDVDTEDDTAWPRWARLGLACVVALAVGVFLASARDSDGASTPAPDPSPTLGDGTLPTGHPSLDGSDQYQDFTLAQLESDAADESAPVALRLTLAERYLATGDVRDARRQARLALDQSGTDVEQQRSLRDLGWAAALSGDSERGAALLQQALDVLPGERNATWYLANVRLAGLNDPAGAVDLFRELLTADDLGADQRSLIQARLAEAEAAAGTGPAPTSTPAAN